MPTVKCPIPGCAYEDAEDAQVMMSFLNIHALTHTPEPRQSKLDRRRIDISVAMSNLWGLKNFTDNGFSRSDLVHVNMDKRAAKKNPFNIQGVD